MKENEKNSREACEQSSKELKGKKTSHSPGSGLKDSGSPVKLGKVEKYEKEIKELTKKNLALEKELSDLQQKIVENEDFTLRLKADFDNYRKRVLEEKERLEQSAGEDIFKLFLKIYDNYTKALDVETTDENTLAFLEGFKMIKQDMDKFLQEHEVVASTKVGDDFDPNIHRAIFFEESDNVEKEKVMDVLQHGYLLKDRLLREAMVKVEKPRNMERETTGEEKEDSVDEKN